MTDSISRRTFVRSTAFGAAALATAGNLFADPQKSAPLKLGIATYTFRNFNRTQLIGFLKQLNISTINAKDTKDHLPADPQQEDAALKDYKAAGIELHAAGAIYFSKNEDDDIRAKFEYCKRAGIGVIVAGDPSPETLPRIEKFVKQYDIRIAGDDDADSSALAIFEFRADVVVFILGEVDGASCVQFDAG